MGNYQNKELRRLEEALMEEEEQMLNFPQTSDGNAAPVYRAVNTDRADVDLDAYSEEVHRGKSGGLGGVLTMLGMILLSAGILLLLKIWGVL